MTLQSPTNCEYPKIWERLKAPSGLDGRHGKFRLPSTMLRLPVDTDLEAIGIWLESGVARASERAYRAAAEKLVNWAWLSKRKEVSSLNADDFIDFAEFLRRPTPAELWVSGVRVRRKCDEWRPFATGLGASGLQLNLSIVKSLVAWLADVGYATLQFAYSQRPLRQRLVRTGTMPKAKAAASTRTLLEAKDVEYVWIAAGQARKNLIVRTQLVFLLQYQGALASSEIAALTMADVRMSMNGPWLLRVPGRQEEMEHVAVLPALRQKLGAFLTSCSRKKHELLLDLSESDVTKTLERVVERAVLSCDECSEEGRSRQARLSALQGLSLKYAFAHHAASAGVLEDAWRLIAARRWTVHGGILESGPRTQEPLSQCCFEDGLQRLRPVLELLDHTAGWKDRPS